MIWRSFLIFLFIFNVLHNSAQAADQLRYNAVPSQRVQNGIRNVLETKIRPAIDKAEIAASDLNNDGIDEYIVRDHACAAYDTCRYVVFADTDQGLVVLGEITARSIALGKGYSHGIRDLAVQNNPDNDFTFERYVWEPQQSRYTLTAGGSHPHAN